MKIKLLIILELLISLASVLSFCGAYNVNDSIVLPNYLVWLPITSLILLIIALFIEYKNGLKPIIRTSLMAIMIFVFLITLTKDINFASISIALCSIVYTVSLIFASIKYSFFNNNSKAVINNSTLAPYIFSKRDLYIQYAMFIGLFIVTIILCLLFNYFNVDYYYVIILIPIFLIIYAIIVNKTSTLNKILSKINYDLDYESFNNQVEQLLLTNIHSETINALLLLKSNYLISYNLEEAIKLFSKVTIPTNKMYRNIYNIVDIEMLINQKKFDEAKEKINCLKNKNKETLQNLLNVYGTEEIIPNIEILYPHNKKLKYFNACSLNTKMYYYYSRHDEENALKYAKELKNYSPKLLEFVKEADEIINTFEK